jgi:hypothetical protein
MNKRKSLGTLGAIVAVVVLLAIGGYAVMWWAGHEQTSAKQTLSSGYEAHALFEPFVLQSKTWQSAGGAFASSGTWTYSYTADASGSQALAAAQKQLSQGGYQIVATNPDVITSTHATLYRDLITGDDSLKVDLNLSASPVTAVVTVSPLEGT